jgi:hypothetical protein
LRSNLRRSGNEFIILRITVSAVVAVSYTLIGGMYYVAYTDVIQLVSNSNVSGGGNCEAISDGAGVSL